jgi:hypothetical protein
MRQSWQRYAADQTHQHERHHRNCAYDYDAQRALRPSRSAPAAVHEDARA